MTNKLFTIFTLCLSLLSFTVSAQEAQPAPEVGVKSEELASGYDLIPVEVWHYGEVSPEYGDTCIFSNVYNNGYALQISEDQEFIRAFIIDFGQAAFVEGQLYPFILMINGAPSEVRGLAVTPSSIRFNLTQPMPTDGFEAFTTNSILVKTEEAEFRFALTGLSEVLKNINGCLFQTEEERIAAEEVIMAETVKPVPAKKPAAKDAEGEMAAADLGEGEEIVETKVVEKENVLYPLIPIVDEETVTVVRAKAPEFNEAEMTAEDKRRRAAQLEAEALLMQKANAPKDKPTVSDVPTEIVKSDAVETSTKPAIWTAEEGEYLSDVIARWSDEKGVKVKWQADANPTLSKPVVSQKPFEEAVADLLKATGLNMDARLNDNVPVDQKAVQDWRALSGMSLETLFKTWSDKAGVTLIWKAPKNLNVKDEYKANASYAEAVQSVLDQFKDMDVRPVGQLNADPETGDVTLIITTTQRS